MDPDGEAETPTPQAMHLAAGLKEAFQKAGATQTALAQAVPCHKSLVTRYFNGERICESAFITSLAEFLRARDVPVPEADVQHLAQLRREALKASTKSKNQLTYF